MIIDLTKTLDPQFTPFSLEGYSDPPLEIRPWASVSREGFCVSRLMLGTQTGTHIDAPAHFIQDGETLETLDPEHLLGDYFLMDMPAYAEVENLAPALAKYRQERILFMRASQDGASQCSQELLKQILLLPPRVLVLAGEISTVSFTPFEFNHMMARAGKFLVEEIDEQAAREVAPCGEIFIFPLRLTGVSGSPCRVIVRTKREK